MHTVKAAGRGLFAAGVGVVVLLLLLLLIMVDAIAASPFGILFSNERSTLDIVPISAAIAQVNYGFNAQLKALQGADTYDDMTIAGEMQFTAPSGRHSVLERPLSEAKRPHVFS